MAKYNSFLKFFEILFTLTVLIYHIAVSTLLSLCRLLWQCSNSAKSNHKIFLLFDKKKVIPIWLYAFLSRYKKQNCRIIHESCHFLLVLWKWESQSRLFLIASSYMMKEYVPISNNDLNPGSWDEPNYAYYSSQNGRTLFDYSPYRKWA